MFHASDSFHYGKKTESAGTEITVLVPPVASLFARLTTLRYRAAGTAHTLTALKQLGETTVASTAAAGQAVVNVSADPGTGTVAGGIAAGDFLAVEKSDGTYHVGKVSSVATLAITLTANVPTGGFAAWARVLFFGAPADHTGTQFSGTASTLESYQDEASGVVASASRNQGVLVHSDNATAAGTLEQVAAAYTTF